MNLPKPHTSQRGFTLLLAALVSSVVLSLGAAIFAIAQKELTLSSTGRNSQFAFYAADTAAECALYWDVRYAYFGVTPPDSITASCDGQALNEIVSSGDRLSGNYTMTFSYDISVLQASGQTNHYCANVSVAKTKVPVTNAVTSVVHADGFSTGCAGVSNDPQSLQRSVELRY